MNTMTIILALLSMIYFSAMGKPVIVFCAFCVLIVFLSRLILKDYEGPGD